MEILIRFNDLCEAIVLKAGAVLLAVFTLSISSQIFLRVFFDYSLVWAQDVAVICFMWSVFIGAPVALRHRLHFIIEIFPSGWRRWSCSLDIICDLLVYIFLYVLSFDGMSFTRMCHIMYFSYFYIPQSVIVASIPVCGLLMLFMNTENLVRDLGKLRDLSNE